MSTKIDFMKNTIELHNYDSAEELVRWFQSRLAGATERVAGCG